MTQLQDYSLDELWDRSISAKTESNSDYWLERYRQKQDRVYALKKRLTRPIDEILKDRSKK